MLKKALFYIALGLPVCGFAQIGSTPPAATTTNFTLAGKLTRITQPLKAYLVYQQDNANVLDSSTFINGNIQFSGTVAAPVNAVLVVDHKGVGFSRLNKSDDILSFYLENGIININGTDSIAKAKITGSQINADNDRLVQKMTPLNARATKLYAQAQAIPRGQQSEVAINQVQAQFKALQAEREAMLKAFVTANPNSYLSLMVLSSLGGPSADAIEIEPLYNSLSQNLRDSEAGKKLFEAIVVLKHTGIGAKAPDFTQNDVSGKPVKLSSFRGKYVLLDFWASWCGPCRQENPNVVKAYNKYKDKNFTVLGVSLDKATGRDAWLAAIKADGLAWTQVSDLKQWNNEAAALYFVTSIPQNFLIDPQGKIIGKNLRGDDLENKLAQILGQPAPAKGGSE